MFDQAKSSPVLSPTADRQTPLRIAESTLANQGRAAELAELRRWLADLGQRVHATVERRPLDELTNWRSDPQTGNITHSSGGFFAVTGLDVRAPRRPVPRWDQPIISQPEVGVLGMLVKEFDGVLHCLVQAKVEPGNHNGLQLSPTVQATRSNYTRKHQGRPVPYLRHFQEAAGRRVLADVRQSEQGAWFHHKRNRNMVVEVFDDVEPLDGFRWLTLGQIHQLLAADDLVNMDARTVLSCFPFAGVDLATVLPGEGDDFRSALIRSCDEAEGSLHSAEEILSWITEARTAAEVRAETVPLSELRDWRRADGKISHASGRFFDVIGVKVSARGREVGEWAQPMIEACGVGVVAFLARPIRGVLHVLAHARVEPGFVDVVELAPTVQCTPDSYAVLPASARPLFLDEVLGASPERIRFQALMSEEGGRFFHTRNRYLVVESDLAASFDHPDYHWMTLHQLAALVRHSHYLNIQTRSLMACLHSLTTRPGRG